MSSIRRLMRLALFHLIELFSLVIPTDRKLIVFSQEHGRYDDNSRALFEWMSSHGHQVRWLYQSPINQSSSIPPVRYVRRKSLKAIFLVARARVVVVSFGIHEFGPWARIARRKKAVMLWHGIALKMLGVLDAKNDPSAIREETRKYSALIASSDIDRYYTVAHQSVPVERVYVTGLPRTDRIVRERRSAARTSSQKLVLYAPTFRDYDTQGQSIFFPFEDYDPAKLAAELEALDIVIALRPHRSDPGSVQHTESLARAYPGAFQYLSAAVVADTADLMSSVDGIITDYSSIYIDLLLFDVPCIFVPFDLEKYNESRGLAYDYDTVTPGPKVSTQAALSAAVKDMAKGAPEWREQRLLVKRLFHRYEDDSASCRVARMIEKL